MNGGVFDLKQLIPKIKGFLIDNKKIIINGILTLLVFFAISVVAMSVFLVIGIIEIGVDVFQFDQPELHGSEFLAKNYGDKATFYSPVDAQMIMPTGDRKIIEEGAMRMVNAFKSVGGGLIAMDYGNWQDLNVLPEWQQWARDVIINNITL